MLFNGLGEISASWARITDAARRPRPGSAPTTAPGRAGATTLESPQDGVPRPRTSTPCSRRRRDRSLRARRALHRRPLRPDLRRPVPRAGGRAWCCWTAPAPGSSPTSPATPAQYAIMRRGFACCRPSVRLGPGACCRRLAAARPAADQVDAMTSTARAARNGRDELSVIPEVFSQAQALTTLADPLVVLTATEYLENPGGRRPRSGSRPLHRPRSPRRRRQPPRHGSRTSARQPVRHGDP